LLPEPAERKIGVVRYGDTSSGTRRMRQGSTGCEVLIWWTGGTFKEVKGINGVGSQTKVWPDFGLIVET
jgi:hypothetical protein